MRHLLSVLLMAGVLVALTACKSAVQLYATRSADMHEPAPPRLQAFAAGEQPAIVVDLPKHSKWGQKAGTLWIDEALTGKTIWNQSKFMREGSTNYFLPEGLEAGTYIATLRSGGEPVATINFDVK
ncbi:exported hypothetical protein [Verrucomicrobia bacterium]|nr:exported hypothetical protein [Verrucomicrobiota bacterium]